ncbi:MAG: thioredoxin family protein, partial [Alphaproteobacteria bacterium]|nr:thioredoxin family protein [Alphaproteobacteria bacterium]
VVLLLVFGLNLLGLFRLVVPQWLGRVSQLDSARPLVSSYLAGVFTTLLATPCTAPVVGTVISFALASQGSAILLVFAALGLGMASPYLLAAVYPGCLSVLPRPGRWMEWLRRVLGLGVLVTAAWLGWVLWMVLRPVEPEPQHSLWQRFESETQITRALEQRRPVLIDITADWCLSCLVNRKLVLDRPEVVAALTASDTLLLRGDWTKPNQFLEQYMARANRYAIPFNQYYSTTHPRGLLLPEILSKDGLLAVIDKR